MTKTEKINEINKELDRLYEKARDANYAWDSFTIMKDIEVFKAQLTILQTKFDDELQT